MNKLIQAIKDKKKEDYEPITPPSDDTIVGREFNLIEELEVENTFDITIEERIIPSSYISEIYLDRYEIQEIIQSIQEEDINRVENMVRDKLEQEADATGEYVCLEDHAELTDGQTIANSNWIDTNIANDINSIVNDMVDHMMELYGNE
jgi:hypothetical protein